MQGRDSVGTVADLHESASKVTGLDDFGADDHREALGVLLNSYAREAGLTPWGNKVNRAMLRSALIARQLSEVAWKQYPEYADVAIRRPIFVTGLPRSGTTALHRLLCADPGNQGLQMWLTEAPQPRPPRESWQADPVFQRLQEGYRRHHVENPEFMGTHYISADMVEECWYLLRQSVMSISYECLAHLPTYSDWLAAQDWTDAYRRHRRNLQLIGLHDTAKRWVLKNPSHLFALGALLAVYPDALIIQTHRDPHNVVASISSLTEKATTDYSEVFRGEVIGRDQLALWSRGINQFMADRAKHEQATNHERSGRSAQFVDVYYDDFVADPIGTVEAVYERFGLELTEEARAAMTELHSQSSSDQRRPSHRYALADFGLSAAEVDERFADYVRAVWA